MSPLSDEDLRAANEGTHTVIALLTAKKAGSVGI